MKGTTTTAVAELIFSVIKSTKVITVSCFEMGGSEDEEDEAEWRNSFAGSAALGPPAAASGPSTSTTPGPAHRVILHFDLDCFYAQVEMIRNPALRAVPLGIQQKYIIVTCNYVARERGVTKLMSVADAQERCPELVLVKGEDLTHYREMSYKVTELLMSHCPLVERLGFDENFMDVTEMVERRLADTQKAEDFSFKGHVYNHPIADVKAGNYRRLALGSHVAAELREAIRSRLGLTGCAGIASNKLLAKLVSGSFKPNQQTTLLPENISDIMDCLSSVRSVPGVGHQTAKRLQTLGLVSVKDLQVCPLNDLVKEFGGPAAQRLKNLALGVDDSPVICTGAPQSLSDEDSFKKMSSTEEVLEKIQQLLSSLVGRMHKDGRQPQTFRLTIRRFTTTNKWFSRESRQCPIPNGVGQKIRSGSGDDAVIQLLPLAMKLFYKMVDCSAPFHLTLINVCFSNLQSRAAAVTGKGSITAFFPQSASPKKSQILLSQVDPSQGDDVDHSTDGLITQHKKQSSCSSEAPRHSFRVKQIPAVAVEEAQRASCSSAGRDPDEAGNTVARLPPDVDLEVFKLLPEEIQKELLSPAYVSSLCSTSPSQSGADGLHTSKNEPPHTLTDSENISDITDAANMSNSSIRAATVSHPWPTGTLPGEDVMEEGGLSSDCEFPGNVDPKVFSELPLDVQRELMSEWKQQKPVLKTPSSRKPGRSLATKDRKAAGKSSQTNNLFKYFKPS